MLITLTALANQTVSRANTCNKPLIMCWVTRIRTTSTHTRMATLSQVKKRGEHYPQCVRGNFCCARGSDMSSTSSTRNLLNRSLLMITLDSISIAFQYKKLSTFMISYTSTVKPSSGSNAIILSTKTTTTQMIQHTCTLHCCALATRYWSTQAISMQPYQHPTPSTASMTFSVILALT
jgi:hypothetical protein